MDEQHLKPLAISNKRTAACTCTSYVQCNIPHTHATIYTLPITSHACAVTFFCAVDIKPDKIHSFKPVPSTMTSYSCSMVRRVREKRSNEKKETRSNNSKRRWDGYEKMEIWHQQEK